MTKLIKIILCIVIISYSLMFYIVFLNEFYLNGLLHYLNYIITHIETLILFPTIFLLIFTLHPKL